MRRLASALALCSCCLVGCSNESAPLPTEPAQSTSGRETVADPAPPPAAPAPQTTPDIRGEEVTYEVQGTKLKGYLAYDAARPGTRPGVLIVHEWWGHNPYVRRRAEMLAKLGYTAFALDMYGEGKLAEHPDDAKKFMQEAIGHMPVAEARFEAARALLANHASTDPEKIAAIGYCFGGGVVLHMARTGADLDAVASFHGSLSPRTPAEPGVVKARVFVAHGAADPFVTPKQLKAFQREMAEAGVDLELVTYEGAKHAFTVPEATQRGERTGLPLAYDEAADTDSWARLRRFLADTFD